MSKEALPVAKTFGNGFGFQKYLTPAVLLGLILLLGAALRFYDLGNESYWIDEMSTVIEGKQSIPQLMTSGRLDQPPGYYLPFHLWVGIFGTNEASTRSFSALAGISSIVLLYLIGRELFGKAVGLLSALLMAITEFQIYYSQIARFYGFFELTTLLSFLFFILALKSKRVVYFAFYAVSSILMVYSHSFGIFILAAQNLLLILQAKTYRNLLSIWLICQVLIMLAFLPYFYPLISRDGGIQGAAALNSGGTPAPSVWDPVRSVYRFILSARRERTWGTMLVNYAAAGVLLTTGMWINAIRRGKSELVAATRGLFTNLQEMPLTRSKLLLVTCWLLSPILFPFILSMVIVPMYSDRYTIGAAPALYLFIAYGIFSIRKVVPLMISLGVLAIMIVPSLGHYYVVDIQDQWRETARYVEENSAPGEVIVFAPNMGIGIQQRTFNWYYRGTLRGCGLPNGLMNPIAISNSLMQCVSVRDRFWVIIPQDSEPYKSFFLSPNQTSLQMIKERRFVGLLVYLFQFTK